MIVLGILDDTSGEVNAVNFPLLVFECFELIGIYFFHDLQSKIDQFFVGIDLLEAKQRARHSPYCLHILFLLWGK